MISFSLIAFFIISLDKFFQISLSLILFSSQDAQEYVFK